MAHLADQRDEDRERHEDQEVDGVAANECRGLPRAERSSRARSWTAPRPADPGTPPAEPDRHRDGDHEEESLEVEGAKRERGAERDHDGDDAVRVAHGRGGVACWLTSTKPRGSAYTSQPARERDGRSGQWIRCRFLGVLPITRQRNLTLSPCDGWTPQPTRGTTVAPTRQRKGNRDGEAARVVHHRCVARVRLEIVRQALARGDAVVATARAPRKLAESADGAARSLLPIALDVNDEGQARAAVEQAGPVRPHRRAGQQRRPRAAGRRGRGLRRRGTRDVRHQRLRVAHGHRAVLPVMRRQRSGRVLNMSSVGGFAASPGWGVYCATKFAVEGLSEALQAELTPLGISVTIVEPGAFRTDFLDGEPLQRSGKAIEDYSATAGQMRAWADGTNHAQLGDPVKAAAAMIAVATGPNPPLRLQLGADCIRASRASSPRLLASWSSVARSRCRPRTPGPPPPDRPAFRPDRSGEPASCARARCADRWSRSLSSPVPVADPSYGSVRACAWRPALTPGRRQSGASPAAGS